MIDFKIFFINHLKGIVSRVMANPRRLYHKRKQRTVTEINVVLFVITVRVVLFYTI